MISRIYSAALYGIDAFRVTVEVHVGRGIGFFLSGLPDDAIKECRSRIEIALQTNEYDMPRTKLSVNLAPADVRKLGTGYDLPVALGILLSSGQVKDHGKLSDYMIVGELGLDGCIYSVRGALSMAILARNEKFSSIIVPKENAGEAALVEGISVYGANHINQVIQLVTTGTGMVPEKAPGEFKPRKHSLDFSDVKGQHTVKRGMEIAAAGGHNSIIIGPPGTGKSMLARRLPSILPPLTPEESLDTTMIYSISEKGGIHGLVSERPFRSPHHTISDSGLAGGGSIPTPGELSLAHNGVLFLDELPEFKRTVIEVLRQPLEERRIVISRAKGTLEFPASFMLLAAMNPCACGYYGHPTRKCTCSSKAVYWYRRKISGPLLDRIDLHIEAEPVNMDDLMNEGEVGESSDKIRKRVLAARAIQLSRFTGKGMNCNAQLPDKYLRECCNIEEHAKKFLVKTMDQFQLSARSYARILKVARTIADLAGSERIELAHIAEAVHFRSLDKPLVVPLQRSKTKAREIGLHWTNRI